MDVTDVVPTIPLPCVSLEDAVISASSHVWGVPSLRSMQLDAILHIVSPTTPNQLLLVDRTGGCKTHVTRTAGIMFR